MIAPWAPSFRVIGQARSAAIRYSSGSSSRSGSWSLTERYAADAAAWTARRRPYGHDARRRRPGLIPGAAAYTGQTSTWDGHHGGLAAPARSGAPRRLLRPPHLLRAPAARGHLRLRRRRDRRASQPRAVRLRAPGRHQARLRRLPQPRDGLAAAVSRRRPDLVGRRERAGLRRGGADRGSPRVPRPRVRTASPACSATRCARRTVAGPGSRPRPSYRHHPVANTCSRTGIPWCDARTARTWRS
jgi:hypothetical protein